MLREHGVYGCTDGLRLGLSLSNAEAAALQAAASARRMKLDLHPRTWLLETRRRAAVVLDWHMPDKVCPFYADFRCGVYDARPLVCRAYPVLQIGKRGLASECPKMPVPGTALRAERKVRRTIEEAHAKLDEIGWRLLDAPGARFAKGLTPREAEARLARARIVTPEAFSAP